MTSNDGQLIIILSKLMRNPVVIPLGHYPSPEWGISEQCHRGPEPQPPTKATSNITTTQAPPDITSTSTPTTPPTALAPARPLSPPGPGMIIDCVSVFCVP